MTGILDDVSPEKSFYVMDGPRISNLEELANFMTHMEDYQFNHHVTKDRNDFINWVKDCIGDKKLVSALRRVKKKSTMAKKMLARVEELKKG